jgi:glycosidase
MKGAGRDENRRAPMFWNADPHAAGMCSGPAGMDEIRMEYGSLEKQTGDPDSIFNYIRQAVRIRESLPAIARGRTVRIPELEEDSYCGFLRTYSANQGADDVLVLINTGDQAVTRRLPDSAAEYRNLCAALYTGDRNSLLEDREITVPAGGILFLQKP